MTIKLNQNAVKLRTTIRTKTYCKKVDALMKLCDELEKKIEKQKDYSNRLI